MKHLPAIVLCLFLAASTHAATLYFGAGTTDIPDGTPLPDYPMSAMDGNWDTNTLNWATDTNGTTYVAWPTTGTNNEAVIALSITNGVSGYENCNVTLGADMAVHHLRGDLRNNPNRQRIYLDAAAPVTLTLNGPDPQITVVDDYRYDTLVLGANVQLAGSDGFTMADNPLDGSVLWIYSDSSALTGDVIVESGVVQLSSGGQLTGIDRFEIQREAYANYHGFHVYINSGGAHDDLGDDAVIDGQGGSFRYQGRRDAASPSTETVGKLLLSSWLHLDSIASSGTGLNGSLTLADAVAGIDRGPHGHGTMGVGQQGNGENVSFNTDVIVQNGYPTGTILPWMAHCGGWAMQLNASGTITNWPMTTAPTDLSTWVPGSDYRIDDTVDGVANISNQTGNLTINSLGALLSDGGETVNIGAGNTLTISSGYIGNGSDSVPYGGWGADVLSFSPTNSQLTTTADTLYLHAPNSHGVISVNSAISGNFDVVVGGRSYVYFDGTVANTYNGTTYIMGPVSLQKNDNVISVPGDINVGAGASVLLNQDQQINNSATVMNRGTFSFGSSDSQTFSGVFTNQNGTIQGGAHGTLRFDAPGTGLVFNGGLFTDTYTQGLNLLLTDVSYAASSEKQAIFRDTYNGASVIRLASGSDGERTFDVADSSTLSTAKPEMVADMPFVESAGTASLRKTGSGVLEMTADHTYSGTTTIEAGTLLADSPGSSTGSGSVIVTNTGTLSGTGMLISDVTVHSGATIAPGPSVGTLTISNNVSMASGSALAIEISDNAGNDLLNVIGNLTIAGHVAVTLLDGYNAPPDSEWAIATVSGTIDKADATTDLNYLLRQDGNDLVLVYPAPGTTISVK